MHKLQQKALHCKTPTQTPARVSLPIQQSFVVGAEEGFAPNSRMYLGLDRGLPSLEHIGGRTTAVILSFVIRNLLLMSMGSEHFAICVLQSLNVPAPRIKYLPSLFHNADTYGSTSVP